MHYLRTCSSFCFLLLLLNLVFLAGVAPVQAADLGQIPARLALDNEFQKAELNKPITVTVTLKNSKGVIVPAIKQEKVQLVYQGQVMQAVIPAGQNSVKIQFTPHTVGIWKMEVSGQSLPGVNGFVQCTDSNAPIRKVMVSTLPAGGDIMRRADLPGRPRRLPILIGRIATPAGSTRGGAVAGGGTATVVQPPAPPTPPPGSPAVEEAAITLKVIAQPEQVSADGETGNWSTKLVLALLGEKNELVAADSDLQLLFSADHGEVQPANITLKKDQSSTFDTPAILSSNWTGNTTLTVISKLPQVQQVITYLSPQPSGLRLEATPSSVINDGKSPVQVVVMLLDETKRVINAVRDTDVVLSVSHGTIDPKVTIPKGQCCAQATLTSAQNVAVTINANAASLTQAAPITANFLFPWAMMIMGALGGMLGAFAHNPRAAFGSHWWRVLVLGLIFGVVLSIAALLGVIGSLPKLGLPVQISKIPSLNTLGALLLGFIGGFYGKKLWKGGGDDDKAKEKAAGQPA